MPEFGTKKASRKLRINPKSKSEVQKFVVLIIVNSGHLCNNDWFLNVFEFDFANLIF
jgi:hypothetical protein